MEKAAGAAGATSPLSGIRGALQSVGDFFATQRHLVAIRDGIVGALPLVLIGSMFLLAAQPPSAALQRWVAPFAPTLLIPYRVLGGMVAVYVTFSAAHSLAKSYGMDSTASGLVAMASFFTLRGRLGKAASLVGSPREAAYILATASSSISVKGMPRTGI